MIQTGKVISVDKNTAIVELFRESACSACHNRDSCGTSHFTCAKVEKVKAGANNLCGASVGDIVELSSDSVKMIGIAFCVFVLPILLGFLFYFVSGEIFDSNIVAYIVATAIFVISFFALFLGFDRSLSGKINVNITRIIESERSVQE